MVTEAAGQEFVLTTILILALNICYLFVDFVSGAFFGLKASNRLVSLTKKDCRERKPSSKIYFRGVSYR